MVEHAAHGRPRRQRNPRGEGYRLRDEILAGATAILERTGTEEAVTLRAVAREIGIAAPSIVHHFADRAAIIDAVVAQQLARLSSVLTEAAQTSVDPVAGMLAAWSAYLQFGRAHPGGYRVIFERRFLPLWDEEQRPMTETAPIFDAAVTMMVGLLEACIDAGRSASTDAFRDSVAVWYFAHGLVALPSTITSFPWPDHDLHLVDGIRNLAHLRPAD
jgi:AcrR family transcriptional regulator